jgi:general secretion pathway protein G
MAKRRLSGFTLIELMVAIAILMILTGRDDLREMRDAIDRYKDASDRLLLREKGDDTGYPKSLDILVKGVEINGGKTVRFLREIPVDPMTGKAEWGMHSMEDDPGSDSWDATVVFDVYSKTDGIGLDGTKYRDW